MSDFETLRRLDLAVRPLTDPIRAGNRYSQFKATFRQTVTLLARELEMLDAKRIVLELGFRDRDLRLDGYPRHGARLETPAVALSFESRWGPQRYATCEFTRWTDNLRAIALSLEALRAVDRYGVSKRGEQYRGWKAIPMSTDPADRIVTEDDALEVLGRYCGPHFRDELAAGIQTLDRAVRFAARETHPDGEGGDADEFRAVMKAKEVLGL